MALYAYINGTKYDALWDFEISEQSGNKTATTISVRVDDQPVPLSGDIIQLVDEQPTGDTVLFWGVCGIPSSPEYQTGLEWAIYEITCGNANSILAYRIANVAYQGYTITRIVQALFDAYIQAEGITLGQISDIDLELEVYTAADMNLQDCLNELADYVGAVWEIRPDRTFWFLAEQDFPQFPATMSMDFFFGGGLKSTTKDYKQRTVQYISGATDFTSSQTETFTYDGEQQSFTLGFPLASQPAITVNGAPVPADRIGVSGLSADDSNVAFVWAYNSQTVSYKENTGYLFQGDTVVFTYTGIFPIRVVVTNDAKISEIAALTGTSGRREMVQIANNVTTQADAITLANSLLSQFSTYTGEVEFFIFSDQLAALGMTLQNVEILTQMTFDLPSLGITGTYVIVERTLTPAYADMSDAPNKLKVNLRLVNRDYVKSYGEVISDLRRDINQLAIRADDLVVNVQTVKETEALGEVVVTSPAIAYYCTDGLSNGSIFAPLDLAALIYPDDGPTVPPGPLPSGYTQVEYIEANGSEFIETTFEPDKNTVISCTFQFLLDDSQQYLFGCASSSGANAYGFYVSRYGRLTDQIRGSVVAFSRNVDPLQVHELVKDNSSCTVDGQKRTQISGATNISAPLYLFAQNKGGTVYFKAAARLYSFKVNDALEETTVMNLIPCITSDGAVGMYDTIAGEFYGNAGNGEFVAGPEVTS